VVCHVSGGHINPAVTIAMIVTSNITIIKGILYILVQCLGSTVGSAILRVSRNLRVVFFKQVSQWDILREKLFQYLKVQWIIVI
jgi:glycerol uptake facilitator-like aquaporin